MKLLVDPELAQKLVDYLKHRPYQEVFGLIQGILQAPKDVSDETESVSEDKQESTP